MIDKKVLIRRLSFTAYFAAAFVLFLFLLFPFDRLKIRLQDEVRRRSAVELSMARISPRFLNSFTLVDVVVADRQGKVLFESPSVRTSVSLFGLLRNVLSFKVRAKAYGGDLQVKMRQGTKQQSLQLDADGLDIGAYPLLKDFGLTLAGRLGGNFEMTGDTGKGRLWFKGLTSRDLKVKGFPIPDLDFEQCWLEADVKGDRLTIRKLELDGKELKARCVGDVVLRERGSLNLTIKLKPSERLAREQAVFSLLKNKDAEGYYEFSLGGTVAEPVPRL